MNSRVNAAASLHRIGDDRLRERRGRTTTQSRRAGEVYYPSPRPATRRLLSRFVGLIALTGAAFPIYWMVNMSLTPQMNGSARALNLVPLDFTLYNYLTAWTRDPVPGQTSFSHALVSPMITTLSLLTVTLALAFVASVAVARVRFKSRRAFIAAVLIFQLIPGEAMIVTMSSLIDNGRLMNTIVGLGIVYLAAVIPFTIWTLRGFVAGVPADLEEAAMIDGCTKAQAFWKITLPLLTPALVATGIFAFVQSWNEVTMSLLSLKGYNLVAPPWLHSIHTVTEATNGGGGLIGTALIAVPVVLLFLFLQGRAIASLMSGVARG